jgi:hypothetical protein
MADASSRNALRDLADQMRQSASASDARSEAAALTDLLRRALTLLARLTPTTKRPSSLPARFKADNLDLEGLTKALRVLELANTPKKAGRKGPKNALAALTARLEKLPRGRKLDRPDLDQALLDRISHEKAQQRANGGVSKSTRAICDELALEYVREKAESGAAGKTNAQGPSAALKKRAKMEGARLASIIAKAEARLRKRRSRERVTNTKK